MDAELKHYLDGKFADLDVRFANLDVKFAEVRAEFRADLEKVETKLLRAFHEWSRPYEIRVRSAVAIANSFDERVGLLEERISELERRQDAA